MASHLCVGETLEVFSDTYEVRAKLGDGGTASVHTVVKHSTGEQFACKLAFQRSPRKWQRIQRMFDHERAMLRRCAHAHVVQAWDLFRGPTQVALVMEHIGGGDIQQLLERHGALSEPAVCGIISQLSSALEHIHSQGVLHRDVKLENLLMVRTAPPLVKLCDFGHAAMSTEAADNFTGTEGYAAPEVVGRGGSTWTRAADVWSMGAVMYAMLANTPLRWANDGPDLSSRTL